MPPSNLNKLPLFMSAFFLEELIAIFFAPSSICLKQLLWQQNDPPVKWCTQCLICVFSQYVDTSIQIPDDMCINLIKIKHKFETYFECFKIVIN